MNRKYASAFPWNTLATQDSRKAKTKTIFGMKYTRISRDEAVIVSLIKSVLEVRFTVLMEHQLHKSYESALLNFI